MSTHRDPGVDERVTALIRELKRNNTPEEARAWAAAYNEHNAEFWKAPGGGTAAMFGHHFGYQQGIATMRARVEAVEEALRSLCDAERRHGVDWPEESAVGTALHAAEETLAARITSGIKP